MRRLRARAAICVLVCLLALVHARADAQEAPAGGTGAIAGIVTSQGTIPLGGAVVTVRNTAGAQLAAVFAGGDGRFRVAGIPAGQHLVSAVLSGFTASDAVVTIEPGRDTEVHLDLPVAGLSEHVEVVADAPLSGATIGASEVVTDRERDQFSPGGGVEGALRLLASVIQMQGGNSIKGGLPAQAGFQLDAVSLADPALGLARVNLPDDAIDSVSVLTNPYAVEYGRFSSGLVVARTRRAGDRWRLLLNDLNPTLRMARGKDWAVKGVASFGPRLSVGGPLVRNRLFLQQAAQYRFAASDVPSRSEDELRTTHRFSSFTRIDASLNADHALVGTVGVFPSSVRMASLGTFTPPEATVDTNDRAHQVSLAARSIWSGTIMSETAFQTLGYLNRLDGQGRQPMELFPDTTRGHFFNTQRRTTTSYQILQSVSGEKTMWGGRHLYKAGIDLLHARYSGTSASRPILIRRADGTLARRLDFDGPTSQAVTSLDVALFVQDRVQVASRWLVEYGFRIDRDGVVGRVNLSPRVGAALLLNPAGSSVLRGGYGVFYERTPSTVGAFDQFERPVETRFAADGTTPVGPAASVVRQVGDLRTPRSATWDAAIDHRFAAHWSIRAGWLDRRGSHELILTTSPAGQPPAVALGSTGRSRYREAEVGIRYSRPPAADLDVSYVRSQARTDLNAFSIYFDTMLRPVVGENQHAPAYSDVPHRLLARGRLMPTARWLLLGVADWRSGVPYSVVDEMLDFVGQRHDRRFPARLRLELGLERRFRIFRWEPWIGVRAYNPLNAFLPTDVQANVGSQAFGSFYNSEYRQIRLQVRFSRY